MDANRSSANAAKRVRIRRSCVGVTGYHQRRWRTPFQLRGYHFTGTPSSSTFARPNGVLLVGCRRRGTDALLRAGCLLSEQERQQNEAPPGGHLQDLVQVRAAEQQRSAGGRPVQLGPVLGEAQLTPLV